MIGANFFLFPGEKEKRWEKRKEPETGAFQ